MPAVGAVPPLLAALGAAVVAAVALVALGVPLVPACGLGVIAAVVTWLATTAREIAEEWARDERGTRSG